MVFLKLIQGGYDSPFSGRSKIKNLFGFEGVKEKFGHFGSIGRKETGLQNIQPKAPKESIFPEILESCGKKEKNFVEKLQQLSC